MQITLNIPDSIKIENDIEEYRGFLQSALNRLIVGGLRYGPPNRRKRYMRRLELEVKAYRAAGNFESLLNICNYAFLESMTPENKKLHFNPAAASATRELIGGHLEKEH